MPVLQQLVKVQFLILNVSCTTVSQLCDRYIVRRV